MESTYARRLAWSFESQFFGDILSDQRSFTDHVQERECPDGVFADLRITATIGRSGVVSPVVIIVVPVNGFASVFSASGLLDSFGFLGALTAFSGRGHSLAK